MPTRLLEHVSVWVDERATSVEAFPHAMRWALCLGLPLRVVVSPARPLHIRPENATRQPTPADHIAAGAARVPSLIETMKAWSAACSDAGIALDTSFWLGGADVGMAHLLRPWGLCVFAESQYARVRDTLFLHFGHTPTVALLVAPPQPTDLRRLAVLYEHTNPNAVFLETAAHLAEALVVRPFIVTVSRTARGARLRRSHAEGVCASLGVKADFDSIVGGDLRPALARLLSAQDCSHLLVERAGTHGAWPQLHGDGFAPWQRLCDGLSILALPAAVPLDVPRRSHAARLAHPARWRPPSDAALVAHQTGHEVL